MSDRVPILSTKRTATLKPLWGKGPTMTLWAENGRVCWENDEGKSGTMSWKDAALRTLALSEMVARPTEGGYASERQMIQQFVCDMEHVIRAAKEQGGPEVSKEVAKERELRRPKIYVMPGSKS